MFSDHKSRLQAFKDAGLYLVTSEALSAGRRTEDIVSAALRGGVRLIQLREKERSVDELRPLAQRIRDLTAEAGALLFLNDHVELALEVGADGVHLGQEDMPVAEARALAPDLVIGVSTHDAEELVAAEEGGASTINIGPIFPTKTKDWTDPFLGLEGLRELGERARVPFSVMGGIKRHHIGDLVAAGARTIALVTAVTAADDPEQATRELLDCIQAARGG